MIPATEPEGRRVTTTENPRALVRAAIEALLRDDRQLLVNDASEQAIAHHLAVHLAVRFPGWHVDCEYNRNMEVVKRLSYAIDGTGPTEVHRVIPDVIVHRRNTTTNLVVLELKKTTNPESDERDVRKLRAFRSELGYEEAGFYRLRAKTPNPQIEREVWI